VRVPLAELHLPDGNLESDSEIVELRCDNLDCTDYGLVWTTSARVDEEGVSEPSELECIVCGEPGVII
jgi:hypothetical protein